MRTHIIHWHHGSWPLPQNRLDSRICPRCKAGVYGSDGQRDHEKDHEKDDEDKRKIIEAVTQIAEHLGFKVTIDEDDWSWGAEITGTEGELEAAE